MAFEFKDIEWIFGGIGVLGISALWALFRGKQKSDKDSPAVIVTQNNVTNVGSSHSIKQDQANATRPKSEVSILFIDDDVKFRVVSILKGHGWTTTRIIKDINSLEQSEVVAADIFFVDIQGVGKILQFKDEGLGLVVALKKRYPNKRVVIYSAESGLNAFHPAFKAADDRISKDADPYEFIEVVERLSS